MANRKRKRSHNSIPRLVFVGISVLFQIGWILLLVLALNQHSAWISLLTSILSLTVVLRLYSKHTTSAMKMPWIMLIMAFPIMGLSLFLLIEAFSDLGRTYKRLRKIRTHTERALEPDPQSLSSLEAADPMAANQSRYLWNHAHSPVYRNTGVAYYGEAVDAFNAMKSALEQAESFIFMEYFIIEDSSSFEELRQILLRKAAQGVDVRLMYDDIGSIGYVNLAFARKLNSAGIQCRVFNPAIPIVNLFMNHRDHRKITVIDGKVGFTGGYNLADEYFGRTKPYGHWKDTGLKLEGEAVRSLTAMFLEMWNVTGKQQEDCSQFLNVTHSLPDASGFVQPYDDDPLGTERIAENAYLNLITSAKKSVYFITPYLIITDEMGHSLELAAKRGVDVRIVTPGIPDKKTVYAVTRSYYADLVSQGVRIYEYTPGFCHAKMCICDGQVASVGTSNLDYRSLYHHFENNVLLYGCAAVEDIAKDFEEIFSQSRDVTEQYRQGRSAALRIWQCILRLFAPLM